MCREIIPSSSKNKGSVQPCCMHGTQLMWVFVFTYANSRFSHDVAQLRYAYFSIKLCCDCSLEIPCYDDSNKHPKHILY